MLDGFLKWAPMGLSPRDMESDAGRAAAAREIALALGVPLLLGLPGDNTYANYCEAQLAFWRNTVWPLATFVSKKLTAWVRPLHGPNIRIKLDAEQSGIGRGGEARPLGPDHQGLTLEEKREELGWEPLPDVPSSRA